MTKETKRLYRSRSNRMLGGVCAGLGEYLNIDATVIRILFVVLAFAYGASFIVYLIMWVLMPEAPQSAVETPPSQEDPGSPG
jgi:phage shock protein C